MPSFDNVNYAIRPNKIVERRIVFSDLIKLSRITPFTSYRYIGFGSLWFVDFLMAHKLLGIESMTSIEASLIGHRRCEFNRPLACIDVRHGESTLVIPTLGLENAPAVVWFDYDTSIGGPVLADLANLSVKCAPNSIIIATINAKKDELPKLDELGLDIDAETSLRQIAGDLVPTPLPPKGLQTRHYPKLLAEILANQIQSAVINSGRPESFVKLFDLVYSDGTPMVTVGGVVASPNVVDAIRQLVETGGWEGFLPEPIAIPPLTIKEKLTLDRMMPSATPPQVAAMHAQGLHLKQEQIDTYHRHYRHYPMLGELLL